MQGAGGHTVWLEPAADAVVVVRWMDGSAANDFMRLARQALQP
jgi:hypothetical protein